jgi:hypothetical protein
MKFAVSLRGQFTTTGEDGAPLELEAARVAMADHLDRVMEELIRLDAEDPEIDLDLGESIVDFSVVTKGDDPVAASEKASGQIRSAIHAAGGGTPGWPHPTDRAWNVRIVGSSSDLVVHLDDETGEHRLIEA